MGYIYKIINTVNLKCYIGRTTATDPIRRWVEHKSKARTKPRTAIEFAIRKYGHKNFKFEILETVNNSDLPITETANIIKHNAMAPNGYNLEIFSPNRILTKEGLENISKNNQGLFKKKNKTSKYMGVYSSANSLYIEIARRNRKYKKAVPTERAGALIYDKLALFLFGDKARINFESNRHVWRKEYLEDFFNKFTLKTPPEEKNIYFDKSRLKWMSRIKHNGKSFNLGRFALKEDAIRARATKMEELGIL